MSDVEADRPAQLGRLLTGLFWAGVGLAPLAGLLLLLGGGGLLKVAAVLAVFSVVLIGLSIALRPDAGAVRAEMEETLLEEIDMLREDVRDDIATAARATHQAFEERLQALQRTVDALRAELEATRSAAGVAVPPGRPGHLGHAAAVRPVAAAAPVPAGPPPPSAPPHPAPGAPAAGRATPVAPPAGDYPEVYAGADPHRGAAAGRAHVPAGVFRHTETVHQVTTRSTFVDQEGYQGGHHAEPMDVEPGWSVPAPRAHRPPVEEESWTDQTLRERYGRRSRRPEPDDGDADEAWSGGSRQRRWDADDEGSDHGRWASRHRDERGEELRLGERRAAMRTGESGSEFRVEDRWAAVRREWDQDAAGDRQWSGWDQEPAGRGPGGLPRRERPALPPADDLPAWNGDGWEEPAHQPRGRRRRAEDDEVDGGHSAGHRRLNFELSDERWR